MDQIYREQLIDHYKNPRNSGSIPNATNSAELKNLSCGDEIKMYLKISDNSIEDVKFEGVGCAVCIASASMLTEIIKGNTVEYLNQFSFEDVEEMLGIEISPSRIKCAHLGLLTMQKAIKQH